MKDFYQEKTATSPLINFKASGDLKLEGRAIPEDVHKLFDPILDWIKAYDGTRIVLDINLEYFNTSVSKQLIDLLHLIESKENVKDITINWHYEEGDDENLESGELYRDVVKRSNFNLIEFAELI